MKVVINRCWGGFTPSLEAQRRLVKAGWPGIKEIEPIDYYGPAQGWEDTYFARLSDPNSIDEFSERGWPMAYERADEHRSHPALAQVVEEMGEAASGSLGKLVVVEVPDGVEFEIRDHDGMESVHEKHRSWT